MYCSQCGSQLNSEAKFCHNCGSKLIEIVSNDSNSELEEHSENIQDDSIEFEESDSVALEQTSDQELIEETEYVETELLDESSSFLGGKLHPWRRFFARTLDVFVIGTLAFLFVSYIIGFMFADYVESFIGIFENPILVSMFIYIIWIQIEAIFISKLGTTPAKWLFGIKVLNKNREKLSYSNSIKRAAMVWAQGEAFGIPFLLIFTRLYAYSRLTKTGTTSWDEAANSVVIHKKWGILRTIIVIIVVFIVLVILSVLNSAGNTYGY